MSVAAPVYSDEDREEEEEGEESQNETKFLVDSEYAKDLEESV